MNPSDFVKVELKTEPTNEENSNVRGICFPKNQFQECEIESDDGESEILSVKTVSRNNSNLLNTGCVKETLHYEERIVDYSYSKHLKNIKVKTEPQEKEIWNPSGSNNNEQLQVECDIKLIKRESNENSSENVSNSPTEIVQNVQENSQSELSIRDDNGKTFQIEDMQFSSKPMDSPQIHDQVHSTDNMCCFEDGSKGNNVNLNFKNHVDLCGMSTKEQHTEIQSNEETGRYIVCSEETHDQLKLNEHFKTLSKYTPYVCDVCFREFRDRSNYKRHMRIHSEDKPFRCDICFKEFPHESNYKRHMKTHAEEKPFKCDFCSKSYTDQSGLREHIKSHSDDKEYKCEVCFKGFYKASHYRRHITIHSNEKPYKCEICSKAFSDQSRLTEHMRSHSENKPYKCYVCLKEFCHQFTYRRHIRIHSDEKPYKCEVCSKEFNDPSNYKQHTKIHSEEKPFKCKICSKEYRDQTRLKEHMKSHSENKPFQCEICLKEFYHKSSYRRHTKIHMYGTPYHYVPREIISELT